MEKTDILSLPYEQLLEYMKEKGEKAFRGKQLYQWMHQHLAVSFEDMKNLPKALKQTLMEDCSYDILKPVDLQVSKLDGTRKYLFELSDGNMVEAVLMHYKHGDSVCISSQVGCKMGCRFCASTLDGWLRNLTPAEMLGQVYSIQRDIWKEMGFDKAPSIGSEAYTNSRISNLVVMGTGEPLDNYDNLLTFIRMLTDSYGLNLSQRSITVSTCGLVPKIRSLSEEKLGITLALSLHAPNQKKREELMPIAKTYEIHQVVDALRDYQKVTGRRVSFEYSLVAGVNDTDEDARELSALIGDIHGHVNLIPVNPIKERDFKSPSHQAALAFQKKLENCGINVTIRREMGRDIDGACGQLRRRHIHS
ncbi:MAG: 23S rRNA (adenine(2503)-C(2))-methyltransferase RlmN [Lachnospiraceae bacterium]|nr:23S rRNA (adenine(2503)-C(2))-methyltransferase RlmN [Lachnospiraceae bacterium]MBQ2576549.1 23S rRNA (adenine(2503)-C(2))-methyltransferase RlmN [Lachnospiraceae bacterium]